MSLGRKPILALLFAVLASAWGTPLHAHPVPRRAHDRVIQVQLVPNTTGERCRLLVHYRIEVDTFTVIFDDLPSLADKAELANLREPREFYDLYLRLFAPLFARNLEATLNGQPLQLLCKKSTHTLFDEKGVPLDHLRCDYVFETEAAAPLKPDLNRFLFKEGNFLHEEGKINVSFAAHPAVAFIAKVEPDEALKNRPSAELRPGDDAKLRTLTAEIAYQPPAATAAAEVIGSQLPQREGTGKPDSMLNLLLDSEKGILVLLVLAAVFGAAHALTPGHGKTLVAAYLVGEKGTPLHAFLLGLVTTVTHTGAVLALAAILMFFFPKAVPEDVQTALGFGGGLLITGMGFWLILRRLTGGADHFHIGSGHHHHHEHHHQVEPTGESKKLSWIGLVVLGISGGIVPCWDAIIMLGFAISAQRLWLGVPLLLAFSAGLASVLILIGLAVVYLKGFASSHWGENRTIRLLPLLSALLVTGMGLWLCYDAIHGSSARSDQQAARGEIIR